ncbi:hypothetical protein FW778_04070 [Ginsengibacter hankyongi]|uniref:Uncharacterized protein n=1 Tax=Ginsengibacter hankyongi TaxID=2607284 RepID=A0A5J5IMS1_9BACT|nr:hypothetical protein FW778_04070 [Ginsengibacter hankyongi]
MPGPLNWGLFRNIKARCTNQFAGARRGAFHPKRKKKASRKSSRLWY